MKYIFTSIILSVLFFANSQTSFNFEYFLDNDLTPYSIFPSLDGGSFLAGKTNSLDDPNIQQGFLTKLDEQGAIVWGKLFYQDIRAVCYVEELSNSDLICVANRRNSFDLGGIVVTRMDAFGSIIWERLLRRSSFDNSNFSDWTIAVDLSTDGSLLVTGHSSFQNCVYKMNVNGDLIWSRKFQGIENNSIYTSLGCSPSCVPTSDGGALYAGFNGKSLTSSGYDGLIVKFDYMGNIVWSKTIDETSELYFTDVVELASKNFIVLGFTNALGSFSEDIILAKFNSNGGLIWSKIYKSSNRDWSNNLEFQYDELVLTGVNSGFSPGSGAGIVMKLDTSGTVNHSYLTNTNFYPYDSRLLINNQVVLTGVKIDGSSNWRINNIMTNPLGALVCNNVNYITNTSDVSLNINNSLNDLGTCAIDTITVTTANFSLNQQTICMPTVNLKEPTPLTIQVNHFEDILVVNNNSENSAEIQIYSMSGTIVERKKCQPKTSLQVNIECLSSGVYYYKIASPYFILSDKIFKH